jgi:hypothetical protein
MEFFVRSFVMTAPDFGLSELFGIKHVCDFVSATNFVGHSNTHIIVLNCRVTVSFN